MHAAVVVPQHAKDCMFNAVFFLQWSSHKVFGARTPSKSSRFSPTALSFTWISGVP
jgi:hypothetical protein